MGQSGWTGPANDSGSGQQKAPLLGEVLQQEQQTNAGAISNQIPNIGMGAPMGGMPMGGPPMQQGMGAAPMGGMPMGAPMGGMPMQQGMGMDGSGMGAMGAMGMMGAGGGGNLAGTVINMLMNVMPNGTNMQPGATTTNGTMTGMPVQQVRPSTINRVPGATTVRRSAHTVNRSVSSGVNRGIRRGINQSLAVCEC